MGHALEKKQTLTFTEYEKLEADATENRYEYELGIVTDMAGAGGIHHAIVQNVTVFLRNTFRPKGCRVFSETMKLEVSKEKKYYYPDVMVACNIDVADRIVSEPIILVEVLSESTSRRDLGSKLDAYLTISSLQAYVIIAQDEYWVRLHEKEDNQWKLRPLLDKPEEVLHIRELGLQLPLSEIYLDVRFDSLKQDSSK